MNVGIVDASSLKISISTTAATASLPSPLAMFKALVDTGAPKTMISSKVAKQLGLKPIGAIRVQGVHGKPNYFNGYLFHIAFTMTFVPPGSLPTPGKSTAVAYVLPIPIHGAELGFKKAGFDVLLGMDVISTGSLKIEGNGTFSFSV